MSLDVSIDWASVNWGYVALLSAFTFMVVLVANIVTFGHRLAAAILAALLFAAIFVAATYYPHGISLPTLTSHDEPKAVPPRTSTPSQSSDATGAPPASPTTPPHWCAVSTLGRVRSELLTLGRTGEGHYGKSRASLPLRATSTSADSRTPLPAIRSMLSAARLDQRHVSHYTRRYLRVWVLPLRAIWLAPNRTLQKSPPKPARAGLRVRGLAWSLSAHINIKWNGGIVICFFCKTI